MTRNSERKVIEREQGWNLVQKGITKLKNLLEGGPEEQISPEECTLFNTTIYNMCTQSPLHDYSQQLYDLYKETFVEYINSKVLPARREKHEEFMLKELVKRWNDHERMVQWLSQFFSYLDRYFIARRSLPTLSEVGLMCFRDFVRCLYSLLTIAVVIDLVLGSWGPGVISLGFSKCVEVYHGGSSVRRCKKKQFTVEIL